MQSRSSAIRAFLESEALRVKVDGCGHVVYVMFLEPSPPEKNGPLIDRLISYAVRYLQPSPAMAHVEVVVPCAPDCGAAVNFATYIYGMSDWRSNAEANRAYYIGQNANCWRALPLRGEHAADRVRAACGECRKAEYSLLRYVSAASWCRGLARFMPDRPKSNAHCATLVARVLRMAKVGSIAHPSSWYGPASLFAELSATLADSRVAPRHLPAAVERDVSVLLGGTDSDVGNMGDARCEPLPRSHACVHISPGARFGMFCRLVRRPPEQGTRRAQRSSRASGARGAREQGRQRATPATETPCKRTHTVERESIRGGRAGVRWVGQCAFFCFKYFCSKYSFRYSRSRTRSA